MPLVHIFTFYECQSINLVAKTHVTRQKEVNIILSFAVFEVKLHI